MKFIKIAHKKHECIGCMLCVEVAPQYWEMNENGEAQLFQVSHKDEVFEYSDGFEEDRSILKEAELGCPVKIIRIN